MAKAKKDKKSEGTSNDDAQANAGASETQPDTSQQSILTEPEGAPTQSVMGKSPDPNASPPSDPDPVIEPGETPKSGYRHRGYHNRMRSSQPGE